MLVLVFVMYNMVGRFKYQLRSINIILLLFVISMLINANGLFTIYDIEAITLLVILPVSYYSFYKIYKNNPDKLENRILLFSSFIIMSSLPFIFHIMEPNYRSYYNIVDFGAKYNFDQSILVGFFKHPSISSKIFAVSSIVVWVLGVLKFSDKVKYKIILMIVFSVGLLSTYLSFTRTGWAMLVLSFIFFVLRENAASKSRKVIYLIFTIIFLFIVYTHSESIQNRVSGKKGYVSQNADPISLITSGRDIIYKGYISSVASDGNQVLLLGNGKKIAIEKNYGTMAHNLFIEIFAYGGAVSILLYIIFIVLLFFEITKYRSSNYTYTLALTLYMLMILAIIPSHGFPIWANIIFGGIIASNRLKFEKNQSINHSTIN